MPTPPTPTPAGSAKDDAPTAQACSPRPLRLCQTLPALPGSHRCLERLLVTLGTKTFPQPPVPLGRGLRQAETRNDLTATEVRRQSISRAGIASSGPCPHRRRGTGRTTTPHRPPRTRAARLPPPASIPTSADGAAAVLRQSNRGAGVTASGRGAAALLHDLGCCFRLPEAAELTVASEDGGRTPTIAAVTSRVARPSSPRHWNAPPGPVAAACCLRPERSSDPGRREPTRRT